MPTDEFRLPAAIERAMVAFDAGRTAEAERLCVGILARKADCFDALHLLAAVQLRGGSHEQALATFDKALALQPRHADALTNRAEALRELGRYDEALASCDRALVLRTNYADALNNRAAALIDLARFDDALASCDRALAVRPDFALAHNNRGSALFGLERFDEAIASFDKALALAPDLAMALANRGLALVELDRIDEALASYAEAQAVQPNFADAHWDDAVLRLMIGDYGRGFEQYEWRWKSKLLKPFWRRFPQPLWLGETDLSRNTILLHSEQGLGDTIQFCRYAKLVARQAAATVLEVQPELKSLMSSLDPAITVIARGEAIPPFDCHAPLMSLPLACRTTFDAIPADVPYLAAPPEEAERWRARLGEHTAPRVGLVWSGQPRPIPHLLQLDRQRSMTFEQFAPLFDSMPCEFYSLQKGGDAAAQLRASPLGRHVIDLSDAFEDFSDTAALIENLDLVIAVDTSVAHLAGALGKPFWLLNRFNTCWRWLRHRDDSPWYPTARIFRQTVRRDWGPVIDRAAIALRAWCDAERARREASRTAAA
jgi:tetratricopeptide (TPR) repeat protein